MVFIYLFFFKIAYIYCDTCGPLGFNAHTLLSPAYWFFDLTKNCPNLPYDHHFNGYGTVINNRSCRIYFNLCKAQTYQCSGSVCVRYKNSTDLVSMLGEAVESPFKEDVKNEKGEIVPFQAEYTGEKLSCGSTPRQVKTTFYFKCNLTKVWNISIESYHGGSRSMDPVNVTFDSKTCEFKVFFESNEACVYIPKNGSIAKKISYGSLILILFFPSLVLYFILGALYNRMCGRSGIDMIPHRKFWTDLPDLIMDGFIFTMATLTCKHEDRYSKEYEGIS